MKNIKKIVLLKFYFLASISIFLLTSCSNDDGGSSSGALTVTSISKSVVDDPLIEGDRQVDVQTDVVNAGNTYIIRGSGFSTLKSISFNGLESVFNSTMVTDNAIVISVDQDTPYYNEMDELKIVTRGGTLIYSVKVRPPSPSITGFPINPNPGDVITITGEYFLRPVVNFGSTTVEPIEASLTEIKVKVPDDIKYKYLSITNVSGTTVANQAFGSAIYDDATTNIWGWDEKWDNTNTFDLAYTKDFSQGSKCIEWKSGEWDAYIFALASWNFTDTDKFKAVRFSVKGIKAGKVKFFINGDADHNFKVVEFKSDSWTYIEIPFSDVGSPDVLSKIGWQEFGGFGGNTILLDDIGLVLK